MKLVIGEILFGIAVAGLAGCDRAAAGTGAPRIQFDSTVCDFGRVEALAPLQGEFRFTNSGAGVLAVRKPTTSCSCTVANPIPAVLKPGEHGRIAFTLNVYEPGSISIDIAVPSNDPQRPVVPLTVKAEIAPAFVIKPPRLWLGSIKPGETKTATVQAIRIDRAAPELDRVVASGSVVAAQMQPRDADGAVTVVVKATGDGHPRRFAEELRAYRAGREDPVLVVPISGEMIGAVSLAPTSLYWGIDRSADSSGAGASGNGPKQLRVVVNATDRSSPIQISNVSSSLPELQVEVVETEKGYQYELVVNLNRLPLESRRGMITFDTGIPSQPKITLPVAIRLYG